MANHGVGNKFASVNLNKSYGQPSNSYGGNRLRSGSRGVGGGMVVLSRHQSSTTGVHKTGPKLSVPPPMNLPSLRKEHERFDSSASASGAAGSGNSGSGSRPTSSGMGWSKLAPSAFQEKDAGDDQHPKSVGDSQIVDGGNDLSSYSSSGVTSGRAGGSVYMPPSAGLGTLGAPVVHSSRIVPVVEKAVVLKGEDFPSLQATLPSASGVSQKQHDISQHRQKQRVTEEEVDQQKDNSYSRTSIHMRPQIQSSRPSGSSDESQVGGSGLSSSDNVEKSRKPDSYFPSPLPLVRLKHTSDWADDERDTGYGISDRERDSEYSKKKPVWNKDFDFPRVGVMPRASVSNLSERRGVLDDEREKVPTREFARGSTYSRDGFGAHDNVIDRNAVAPKPSNSNREMNRETKCAGDISRDGFRNGDTASQEFRSGRKDADYGPRGRQNGDSLSGRGAGYNARERFSSDHSYHYKGDFFPKSLVPKTSFSSGTRGPAVNDPVLNFVKEKRSSSVKPYLEDPFLKDIVNGPGFDGRDPLAGGLVGVFKRKKDISKQDDFHDPVRESFEAELERVQKMQEQERQRILDEQTRAVEIARQEEEFAREVIERQRRLEEEAREVAWRAEQERLEAIRRAEEQKAAREEEKRRMQMEEERRKEAARKKLLELEARIARRQSEAKDDMFSTGAARNDKMFGLATETDVSMVTDVVDWEDGERMVERITNSASSDSSNPSRSFEMGSRPPYIRSGDSVFSDRVKPGNAWRRDVFEYGNSSSFMLHDQDNDYCGPRRDTFGAGRAVSRTDFYGSPGFISGTRPSSKGGFSEPHQLDEKAVSSRCDSQSSLSVSSPPHSPTHLSGDDLEDLRDFPVLQTAAKGEEFSLSENEHDFSVAEDGKTNNMTTSGTVSRAEDEEWDIENAEKLQEQEEYDENDGYLEEDEVQEGDDENINLSHEFEHLNLEVEEAADEIGQTILGFDGGVEVQILSGDEFEKSSRDRDLSVGTQQGPAGNLDEGSFMIDTRQAIMPENSSLDASLDSSSPMTKETENAVQDLVFQSGNSSTTSSGYLLGNTNSQPAVTSSSVSLSSPIAQPMMPAVSSGVSQGEVPMTLQFGLFSGPSLIPSPVPTIQIGSIQMPLHIHPSQPHMHPSQPPFFQFGQLRYASPMTQSILPLAPQSVSFVQPSVPARNSFNQNQESSVNIPAESSVMLNDQPGMSKLLNISQDSKPIKVTVLAGRQDQENEVLTSHSQVRNSILPDSESRSESLVQDQGQHDMALRKNYRYAGNNNQSQGQVQAESTKSQFMSRNPGPISGGRGKRFIYTVKNSGSRPSFPVSEAPHSDFSGFQRRPHHKFRRTEFRVRETVEKRHTESVGSSENSGMNKRLNFHGRMSGFSGRNGVVKKEFGYNRQSKHPVEYVGLNSDSSGSRVADSERKTEKRPGKEASTKRLTSSPNVSDTWEENPRRNSSSVEDVDVPMQSGIVRVFRQTGIEAPSDEDDFIEVRSKRQMLIDRRELREREIKAKSRMAKASRKPRYVPQNPRAPVHSNKPSTSLVAEASSSIPSTSLVSDGKGTPNVEVVSAFKNAITSQPLAPIGTPALTSDGNAVTRAHSIKPLKNNSIPSMSNNGANLAPGSSLDNKSVAMDNMPTYLGSWGSARINQQVMTLTQTQLDDAMKTTRFDGDFTAAAIDCSKPSSSILLQDKSFSSSASPLSSLLAGEKIQFGAVTSPAILPSSSRAVSSDLGPPGSSRPDASVDHTLSAVESGHSFFDKERCPDESCVHLDDPEAEAEAAASAVAVAAISSDEIVGTGACPVSSSGTKGFGDADIGSLASAGGSGNHRSTSQSRSEESLTVALPADLSVETPSLSLWPPLPSPQNSSSQMLSHFPGAPPSQFPWYEMNPMLGPPMFAFAPHDESAGTDSQSQKSTTSGSGPLGGWQSCHSGVDSFYGPPAGFAGPFISPPGGMSGVQGPPHMVVYNHFTPVGQFGQVGLSFMGATYIPSGKQPDWKHHPIPSTMGTSEGDMNNLNITSAQRNPSSIPTPVQHLPPGSPLLPLGSHFGMFGMSQFQSSTDVPVQACWSHVPASHLHSVPLSVPLQQGEGGLRPQFSHGLCMDQSAVDRFHDPSTATLPQDNRRNFPASNDATIAAQFPDELGLVEPAISTGTHVLNGSRTTTFSSSNTSFCSTNNNGSVHNTVSKGSSRINAGNNGAGGGIHSSSSNNQSMNSAHKNQSSAHHQQNSTHQHYNLGQRAKTSSTSGSEGEWSHRRMGGFQGRNQSSGVDNKNFGASKMKQIYVAKTTTSGTSTQD
ncbi:uncharacterized protein LOC113284385 [Papaver somniferum]|uniref:uncharacterized protein LOC113284385 n=1 Tax=Papaver somniferum TaxID=3469 RepID=UPI000E6FF9EB|nr:uncharacterized protein LOC113284385 [Papaver somniferum]